MIYIVAFIVAALLVVILFFALRSTVKRIDYNTKKYFVDKLQDYDYLIEEKQQILNKLNKEIEENKKNLIKMPEEEVKIVKHQRNNYQNLSTPKYIDQELFKKYKHIKEKFSFNYNEIIKKFMDTSLTDENTNYKIALNIKNKFTNEEVYKIINLREKEQKEYILNLLDLEEKKFLENFINLDKFKVKKLITNLDTFLYKNDPKVYIYTGDKNANYNEINSNIETVYDESINEGIRIHYKGIIHDYSL